MIRTFAVAAMLASAFALPVMATDAAPAADTAAKHARFAEMKAKHGELSDEQKSRLKDRMAARKAHRAECEKKLKAADTPEKAKYVREQCKMDGKGAHGKKKGDREAWKAKHEGKRGEWKAKREAREKAR